MAFSGWCSFSTLILGYRLRQVLDNANCLHADMYDPADRADQIPWILKPAVGIIDEAASSVLDDPVAVNEPLDRRSAR